MPDISQSTTEMEGLIDKLSHYILIHDLLEYIDDPRVSLIKFKPINLRGRINILLRLFLIHFNVALEFSKNAN